MFLKSTTHTQKLQTLAIELTLKKIYEESTGILKCFQNY